MRTAWKIPAYYEAVHGSDRKRQEGKKLSQPTTKKRAPNSVDRIEGSR